MYKEITIKDDIIKLLQAEIKKYRRQDIIISERETIENEKISKILEELIFKIKKINY